MTNKGENVDNDIDVDNDDNDDIGTYVECFRSTVVVMLRYQGLRQIEILMILRIELIFVLYIMLMTELLL